MKTSIIILTLNQLALTQACIDSIIKHTAEPYEIIVVDNGSKDGTKEYLRSLPYIRTVFNMENKGYAKGCNQGAAMASGDNLLFLNNDTVVTKDWLKNMLRTLYSKEIIGMAGPISNSCNGPQKTDVRYKDLSELDNFAEELRHRQAGVAYPSSSLVGFCLLIKQKVWAEIGAFDERYGIGNFEDDDLCLSVMHAGYLSMVVTDSFVHHVGSATFQSLQDVDYWSLLASNRELAAAKWGADVNDLLSKPQASISLCFIADNNENPSEDFLDSATYIVDEIVTNTAEATKDYLLLYPDPERPLSTEEQKILLLFKQNVGPSIQAVTLMYGSANSPSMFKKLQLIKQEHIRQQDRLAHANESAHDDKKICIISCVSNHVSTNKAMQCIKSLQVPEGFFIEMIQVYDARSMASGYNEAMKQTNAKYKIYMNEDVRIVEHDFLLNIIRLFTTYPELGMLGVAGATYMPDCGLWWNSTKKYGKVMTSYSGRLELLSFRDVQNDYERVKVIDGLIMTTQQDIRWREDLFHSFHFYGTSQSLEFSKAGYEVGVLKQGTPTCVHQCGISKLDGFEEERQAFHQHYHMLFSSMEDEELRRLNWTSYKPEFDYERKHPLITEISAWRGHQQFAYDFIRWLKPKTIVELGTHWGLSFFSFCQAVVDGGFNTKSYAVDTWLGDSHAGYYQEEVYKTVLSVTQTYYSSTAKLMRSTFDDALASFEDESIDVLHIDGFHTYKAVSHDYYTWLPKVARNGIVLFHDISVKVLGFEVYWLWEELKQHPHLEFQHCNGLGILFPKGCSDAAKQLLLVEKELQVKYE